MIKNKKGFSFRNSLVALVVLSLFILAIGNWIDEWNSDYSSGLTYDLGEYSKLDEMSDYAQITKTNITVRSSYDTSSGDFEGTSLRGAFGIVNNIFVPFQIVFANGGLLDSIEDRFNIPNYIVIGIASILIITIVWGIIGLFFRRESTP